jgi:hypothetical protein
VTLFFFILIFHLLLLFFSNKILFFWPVWFCYGLTLYIQQSFLFNEQVGCHLLLPRLYLSLDIIMEAEEATSSSSFASKKSGHMSLDVHKPATGL